MEFTCAREKVPLGRSILHYFYEHNNEYIPWKIFLSNVTGCYNSFDNGSETMNFIFNDH